MSMLKEQRRSETHNKDYLRGYQWVKLILLCYLIQKNVKNNYICIFSRLTAPLNHIRSLKISK